jgi:hypothetical protein
MPVIMCLKISDIKPERHAEFLNWLGEIVAVTKMFSACQWTYVTNGELDIEDNKIENKVEVVALWDSKEDYMKYIEWRNELGTGDKLAEYVNSDPVWRFMPVLMDCTK